MKKKSALQKKKDKTNSSYWLNKCNDFFMSQFRGQPCAICGATDGTVGHHIIPKSRSKALRFDINNIIVLCPGHHTMGGDMAPHSMSQMVMERYIEWFKVNRTGQWLWAIENEHLQRRYTYKQAFINMSKGLDAWA